MFAAVSSFAVCSTVQLLMLLHYKSRGGKIKVYQTYYIKLEELLCKTTT